MEDLIPGKLYRVVTSRLYCDQGSVKKGEVLLYLNFEFSDTSETENTYWWLRGDGKRVYMWFPKNSLRLRDGLILEKVE